MLESIQRSGEGLSAEELDLLDRLLEQEIPAASGIRRRPDRQWAPLSFAQERFWFLDHWHPGNPSFHIFTLVRLEGDLDIEAFHRGLSEIVRRHEVLRLVFEARDQGPVQIVVPPGDLPLPRIDLRALSRCRRESEARRLAERDAQRPFDLRRGPLLRIYLAQIGPREHQLFLTTHHIVSDGWSTGILVRELMALYLAFSRGETAFLPELRLQYGDFAAWQREELTEAALEEQLSYWQRQLDGAPAVLELPTDRPRPAVRSFAGACLGRTLPRSVNDGLGNFCSRRRGVTPFMTLVAAFKTLLHRYTGQRDLVIGTPVANRHRMEIEELIGCFVNSLVLRTDLGGDPRWGELVERLREVTLDAYAHQDLPFEKLVETLGLERDPAHTPLFQVVLVLQNTPRLAFDLPGITLEVLEIENHTAKFDLTATFSPEADGGLRLSFEYSRELFDASTIDRMSRHFRQLLVGTLADSDRRLSDLPLLQASEQHELIHEWNVAAEVRSSLCLPQRFEAQVERSPDAVALIDGDRRFSYRELNARANRLAHRLRAMGAGPETLVGILSDRRAEIVVAILAVLKAGSGYLPLDPAYPDERLHFLLEDARAPWVLTQAGVVERIRGHRTRVLDLDELLRTAAGERCENPPPTAAPENLAYVIYTSGSTGRPKGVMVTHAHVGRLFDVTAAGFGFGPGDVWTFFHSHAFDFSVWEIWGAFNYGGRLVVVPYLTSRSPEAFYQLLSSEGVSVLNQTPSAFRQLVRAEDQLVSAERLPLALRLVIFGGEALEPSSLATWVERHGGVRLVNMYGITETTVHVTQHPVGAEDVRGGRSLIGWPIPDLGVHVLDARGRLLPIGVPGELFVGGGGVSRGYLGRPALTARRFVPDPWTGRRGARLYRTGDLGRRLANGCLEYLGRIDNQVQIRGFRVELGEIEAALEEHPAVARAVVVAREEGQGDHRLLGYVVPQGAEPGLEELRSFLREKLPEHMVPAILMPIARVPLTAHGKVDVRALPEPAPARPELEHGYVPPQTPVEEILAEIWGEVLGIFPVGIHDNFFSLGGDSIRSVQVISLAKQRGLELSLPRLFELQTVHELAAELTSGSATVRGSRSSAPFSLISESDRRALPAGIVDAYPLTYMQAGMLYHMALDPEDPPYHNVDSSHLRAPIEIERFREAVQWVVDRHPMLRTSFAMESFSEPLQLVHESAVLEIGYEDLSCLSAAEQEEVIERFRSAERHRLFDPTRPPLLRFHIHRRSEDTLQFTLSECHPIFDGWSLTSTLAEIFDTYFQLLDHGRVTPRPLPPVTFRDFVQLEREALASEESRDFWNEKLDGAVMTRLPRWPVPLREAGTGIRRQLRYAPDNTLPGLRKLAAEAKVPLKSVLLAAYLKTLSLVTGQRELVTGLSTNGRLEEPGGDQVRGIHLNTLPLRLRLSAGSWLELAREAWAAESEILPHRRFPGAALHKERGNEPLFETLFNFTHFHSLADVMRSDRCELLDYQWSQDTHFPLLVTFSIVPGSSRLGVVLSCDSGEIGAVQMEGIAEHLEQVLAAMVADPHGLHSATPFLAAAKRRQIFKEWGVDRANYPRRSTIPKLVAQQVKRTPEAVAVVCGERSLSYAELRRESLSLAARLRGLGLGRGSRVGVFAEHSPETVAALLGVLEIGAAYVPLDPAHPPARLRFVAKDAGLAALITQGSSAVALPVALPTVMLGSDQTPPAAVSAPAPEAEDVAYVIYTSGSTGQPKGVAVSHRSLVNYIWWAKNTYVRGEALDFPLYSSLAFDLTVTSLYTPLVTGNRLVVYPQQGQEPAILDVVRDDRVGVLKLTPSHLTLITDAVPEGGRRLRRLILGGEALEADLARRAEALFGAQIEILNEYGPTEASVGCMLHRFDPAGDGEGSVPIGGPGANARIFILDPWLNPVDVGVPGELYVGGDGVAQGYLGRPGMSAERFVPDPFSRRRGARLYRTGDLARWFPGGRAEFLGRRDEQVKVRGHRTELGEIRAAINRHPKIRDSVVRVASDPSGKTQLVAYYAARQELPEADLCAFLREHLLAETIPSFFVHLKRLPLTLNGKVNFDALPRLSELRKETTQAFEPPRTPVEEVVANVWQEVLGVDRVGRSDNFFEIGGHSLLAGRVISRLRALFDLDLPLRVLLEAPTVEALAQEVEERIEAGLPQRIPPLEPRRDSAAPPLSFAQQRLWFLDRFAPGSATYNMPAAVRITGSLSYPVLEGALDEIVRRHESLRTCFEVVDGEPVQVVSPPSLISLPWIDLSGHGSLGRDRLEAELERLLRREARRPFDLAHGAVLRLVLVRFSETEHVFFFNLHHIVSDGWSMGVLVRELGTLYRSLAQRRPSPLPELPVQYADYAVWQRGWLRGEMLEAQLAYWRGQLAGLPTLDLPTDRPYPAVAGSQGASRTRALPGELSQTTAALSRSREATPFMVFTSALAALLCRYSGQRDFAVGTPVTGRHDIKLEPLIGLFVNTLVLRFDLGANPTFDDLVDRTRRTALEAFAHQDVPFEKLVEELQPERALYHHPFFQTMLVYQEVRLEEVELPGACLDLREVPSGAAKFDLSWVIEETGQEPFLTLNYRSDLFDTTTALRMLRQFQILLEGAAADPGRRLSDLPLLDAAERHQLVAELGTATQVAADLLDELHDTSAGMVDPVTLHGGFERQAAEAPDRVALSAGDEAVTYGELEARSNQLAHHLHRLGVGSEVRIAICAERSPERMVGVLGVLKAGAAYVPLDPEHPAERLSFLLEDCGAELLLIQERLLAVLPETVKRSRRRLVLDGEAFASESTERLPVGIEPDQLAYVIYTSGSTGQPKGVMIPHRGLPHRLAWLRDHLTLSGNDRVLVKTSSVFDVSLREIFWPLSAGARLVLAPPGAERDSSALVELLRGERITAVQFVPSMLAYLAEEEALAACPLRHLISGGEVLPPALARTLGKQLAAKLYNSYGPTEASLFATLRTCARIPADGPVPLGRPLTGTGAYVLDRRLKPQPIGVPGELVLSGVGLGRGYLGKPGQTADRFVPHPFSNDSGARLYLTGDLVRWRPDGELEFLGRVDDQVKVRGFRIELGEIEACLATQPAVRQAAVRVWEDASGNPRLVAYVTLKGGPRAGSEPLGAETLKQELARTLPDYMIPSHFVVLEALPLLPSGKIDRGALPAPAWTDRLAEKTYVPPRDPFELELVRIWEEVLGVFPVGIRDNFFDLGGHSLLATQLMSRVRSTFRVDVALRALFEGPTVATLAERVKEALRAGAQLSVPPLTPMPRDGALPLSFAQERLWFLDQLHPGSSAYNMSLAVRLTGELDLGALARSLSEVMWRHENLRTVFELVQGEPRQSIRPAAQSAPRLIDLRALAPAQRETEARRQVQAEARRPFDLARGPLVRTLFWRLEPAEHVVLIHLHHIVGDGWSLGILQKEIQALYQAFVAGKPSPLPELTVQYGDFAVWQRSWLTGEVLEGEIAWWRRQLAGLPEVLELPTDRPRPPVETSRGAAHQVPLPRKLAEGVEALGRQVGATPFMVTLAALSALLARHSTQQDLAVGTPIAGRNRLEIEDLVGFFVNTLVLRANLRGEPSFRELIARVRETALAAYTHQDVPFEKLVEELAVERSLAHSPLFQVMFSLDNAAGEGLTIPGLQLSAVGTEARTAIFDLSVGFTGWGGEVEIGAQYRTDLFDSTTIKRLLQQLVRLLGNGLEEGHRPVASLPLLGPAEVAQVQAEWNDTAAEGPRQRCLHELFEVQAAARPDAVAVVGGAGSVSYGKLAQRAGRLADLLRRQGIGPEMVVGIWTEASVERIVAVFAVLRAGAAYLPLDPMLPRKRLVMLLEDAGAAMLLTEEKLLASISGTGVPTLCLDRDLPGGVPTRGTRRRAPCPGPDNLAYVMYTSGSTGPPKGVGISHRSALWYAVTAAENYGISSADRVLHFSSFAFDISVEEIFPTLVRGATLVLGTEAIRHSASHFLEQCRQWNITVLAMATAFWHELSQEVTARSEIVPESLRLVCFGGERVMPESVVSWQQRVPARIRLFNSYGPTETTVVATLFEIRSGRWEFDVPIGRPIPNARALILDRTLETQPPGVPGELFLGGEGLARGYLGAPAKTARSFVPDPTGQQPGGRLYRTGDLARWLPCGLLKYLGRVDDQVKVRGFRIELGEIEATLAAHAGVREAVVLAREDVPGHRRLVAYTVGEAAGSELSSYLAERLPEYMLPAAFVVLESLPLTPHGKLDRRALPAPSGRGISLERAYVAPRTPVEELLAAAFAEILGLEQIGVHDDFFSALGGHSLLATQLMSRVRSTFRVDVALRALFEAPTVATLAERVEEALRAGAQLSVPPLTPLPRDGALPLSFAQERLWFLDQLHPGSSAYNMPMAVRLTGELDLGALARSLSEVMRRHENLRTVIELADGELRQSIRPAAPIAAPLVDLRALAPAARQTEARRQVQAEGRRPFDLTRGPLVRTLFLRLEPAEHVVLIHLHHIVGDGWSLGILQAEIQALYQAFVAGKPSPLPELEIQYADYAVWQRGWLAGEVLEAQLAYWREQLAGVPTLELPADHPRPAAPSHRGATRTLALPGEVARGISALGRGQRATPYMVLLAGLKALLYRYTGQHDLSVGTPVAGRHHMEIEKLIGLFVNTLVLRTWLRGELSFRDLVDRVRDTALAAYTHQDIPFEKLVEELQPERSLNRHPLFQVMFAYEDHRAPRIELPGTTLSPEEVPGSTVRFDLSWRVSETGSAMVVTLNHRSELFESTTAERLLRHFRNLLQGAAADPGRCLADLPILDPVQRHQLLEEFHGTPAGPVDPVTLHGGFERQAAEAPDRVALSAGDEELTYGELEARSNQLAHHLHRLGVGSEVRVGICAERSPEQMVGVLGVLKAGAAYVPLDPEHPAERLSFVLEDCGAELLLIQDRLLAVLPETVKRSRRRLLLDGEAFAGESAERLPVEIAPDQLAYVIYTSGSTGRPKGVMIPHRGLPHRLAWLQDHLTLSGKDRVLVKTPSVFDVSLREMFWPLSAGARLVLAPPGAERGSSALVELLCGERITAVQFVPSMLAYLAEEEAFAACPLRHLISGGEVLPPALARSLGKQLAAKLYNSYGPTETSLFATLRTCARIPADGSVPLGRSLPGTGAYVLDRRLKPQPIGVAGELALSGVGLGRGYLGKPGQTADRFVPHPFSNDSGARLYRTGDLVRWLPDGELEFLGRVDDQVKVRGFRIELGEIEACLAAQPAVRQAAVRVREDAMGNPRLVAYVVTLKGGPRAGSEPLGAETLKQELARTLPDHMIPSHFVVLEAFPLLPSGKIDRGALPAPAWTDRPTEKTYVPPRDPFELELAAIWEEVLGVFPVGIRDNFFELGGHSLLAVRLVTRIEQRTGTRLPLASLFQAPTLQELSPLLRSGRPEEPPAALVGIRPQGSARPLFLVHGGGGNVLSYAPLAAYLDPERPVYGLQSVGLHEGQRFPSRVAEMAARYLEEIRAVAPSGPYLLAGWSAGGTIAFEMAQQLLDQDEEVSLLFLIDAHAPGNRPPQPPDTLSLLAAFAAELGIRTPPAALVTELFAELESLPPEQQLTRALELARQSQLLPGGIELPQLRRLFRVFEANVRAVAAYEPRPYAGRAVVVRAAEGNPSAGPDLGWSEWIAEIGETAAVPGDHYGILRPGGAEALAELLNRWTARCEELCETGSSGNNRDKPD